jgi:hypothetical protein
MIHQVTIVANHTLYETTCIDEAALTVVWALFAGRVSGHIESRATLTRSKELRDHSFNFHVTDIVTSNIRRTAFVIIAIWILITVFTEVAVFVHSVNVLVVVTTDQTVMWTTVS